MRRYSRTQGFSTRYLAYLCWTQATPDGPRVYIRIRVGGWRFGYRHPVVRG